MLTEPPTHISQCFQDAAQRGRPAALRAQGWRLRPELQLRQNHGAFCQREEEEKGETIPPSPSLSSTEPGTHPGTRSVSLPLLLIPLPSAPPPGLCSCRGVGAEPPSPFSRDAPRGRALLSCPGRAGSRQAALVPSQRCGGGTGKLLGSDRHEHDSFPLFIPPLPIQQPSHFFSLAICIQTGDRFACWLCTEPGL